MFQVRYLKLGIHKLLYLRHKARRKQNVRANSPYLKDIGTKSQTQHIEIQLKQKTII